MRHGERHRLRDRIVLEQGFVHFSRRDLLAAAIDEFLEPTGNREVAVRVVEALVARAEPSVRERFRVRFRVIQVAVRDARPPHDDLASFESRQELTGLGHYSDFRPGRGPDSAGLALPGR